MLESEARALDERCPHVPPGIADVIERCLRKAPPDRFASAAEILAAASEEAKRAGEEAHRRMTDFVDRRTAAAEAKIAQAEAQATADVRAAAADAAIRVSETILREKMTGQTAQDLVAKSLADIRAKLSS